MQNQFGGQVGGPIPKLKDTFWFFSYEGTRQKNGVSSLVSGSQEVLPAARTAANLGGRVWHQPHVDRSRGGKYSQSDRPVRWIIGSIRPGVTAFRAYNLVRAESISWFLFASHDLHNTKTRNPFPWIEI